MSYVGLDEFAQYGIGAGDPATVATVAFGNLVEGTITPGGDFDHAQGIGGQDDIVWHMIEPSAELTTVYKGDALLENILRSDWNGLPPRIGLWGGIIDDTNALSYKLSGYVNEVEISCGVINEAARVVYRILGDTCTAATIAAASVVAPSVTAPSVWDEGDITVGGTNYSIQSFTLTLHNGLRLRSSLDSKSGDYKRLPEVVNPGDEWVELSITSDAPYTGDLLYNTPTMPVTAAIVLGNGYTTKTINVNALYVKPSSVDHRFVGSEDEVTWDWTLESKRNPLISASTQAIVIT